MSPDPAAVTSATREQLPMTLDAVLRLAGEQNPQIMIAQAKVAAACAEKDAAAQHWIPEIYLGTGYFRHAGGIQLQEGPLITSSAGAYNFGPQINAEYNPRDFAFRQLEAARKVWQNQGDLSKITYEQLLEASTTYIDLLAAYSALAVSQELEAKLKPLFDEADKFWKANNQTKDVQIEVLRVSAEIEQQKSMQKKLRGQIDAASAKLCYLLGLDPNTQIVPADTNMVQFHIVDVTQPTDALVTQALANGPGVRELEGILAVINAGLDTAKGPARWVPIINFQMGEGLFAAGPFGTLDWANRWDMAVQARWNISDLFTAKRKREVAMAQAGQVNLTYQDLRAKLTLGVHEARSTVDATTAQLPFAEQLIKQAQTVLSNTHEIRTSSMPMPMAQPKPGYSDEAQAQKAVAMAKLNLVDMMREYDKAQLRLLVLLGPGAPVCEPGK
jgi:outer membrane protein TolC